MSVPSRRRVIKQNSRNKYENGSLLIPENVFKRDSVSQVLSEIGMVASPNRELSSPEYSERENRQRFTYPPLNGSNNERTSSGSHSMDTYTTQSHSNQFTINPNFKPPHSLVSQPKQSKDSKDKESNQPILFRKIRNSNVKVTWHTYPNPNITSTEIPSLSRNGSLELPSARANTVPYPTHSTQSRSPSQGKMKFDYYMLKYELWEIGLKATQAELTMRLHRMNLESRRNRFKLLNQYLKTLNSSNKKNEEILKLVKQVMDI